MADLTDYPIYGIQLTGSSKHVELLRERLRWAERDYESWRKGNG